MGQKRLGRFGNKERGLPDWWIKCGVDLHRYGLGSVDVCLSVFTNDDGDGQMRPCRPGPVVVFQRCEEFFFVIRVGVNCFGCVLG